MKLFSILRIVAPGRHAALVLALATLCFATVSAPTALAQATDRPRVQLADAIVAIVNNEVITRHELNERLRRVERTMKAQGIGLPPRGEFERQVLESMIIDRAQLQLARESGIRVEDATLDRAVAGIAEQNRMSLPEFRVQLEREGLPFVRFREEIREEILMQRVREREVGNRVQVTESEVDNFLSSQALGDQGAQEYNAAHILVRIPENASAEQIAERARRAEEVLQRLRAGADFASVAATYSDASDALGGGDLGWRPADRLPQLFVEAMDGLSEGQISPLLRSANGFHIIKLNGKRSPEAAKLAGAPVQQTRVRHILIKVNQITTANDARRKLAEIKQRLDNKAASFEELARLFSNDLSASKGGDLGWIYPGDTVPEFERAMDALEPGQVSEPIASPFGMHLIQVMERKQDDVSKDRLRLIARQAIRERKLEEATQDWLRQVRDRAYVELRLDDAR
jgi:peptidyl-prolyl cis-trans isomerase SurA